MSADWRNPNHDFTPVWQLFNDFEAVLGKALVANIKGVFICLIAGMTAPLALSAGLQRTCAHLSDIGMTSVCLGALCRAAHHTAVLEHISSHCSGLDIIIVCMQTPRNTQRPLCWLPKAQARAGWSSTSSLHSSCTVLWLMHALAHLRCSSSSP